MLLPAHCRPAVSGKAARMPRLEKALPQSGNKMKRAPAGSLFICLCRMGQRNGG